LFPASIGKTGKLSRRPLVGTDAADMLKRRLKQAGLPAPYSPHSFRATGIPNFLENDGTLDFGRVKALICCNLFKPKNMTDDIFLAQVLGHLFQSGRVTRIFALEMDNQHRETTSTGTRE
jgi:hypothetical protein